MSINYSTKEAFNVYIDYLAIKRHFTNKSYDYHKYNGKVKASFESFQTRNDAFFFYKLSKKLESRDIILSNILHNQNVWIREITEEKGDEIYKDWKKRIDGLTYQFQQDLKVIDEDYKSNFIVTNGQHPKLVSLFLQRKISLETFTILTNLSNVFEYWDKNIVDKIVAYDKILLSRKYFKFLDIDQKKFSQIIKNHLISV
jgi:hypothetical protein